MPITYNLFCSDKGRCHFGQLTVDTLETTESISKDCFVQGPCYRCSGGKSMTINRVLNPKEHFDSFSFVRPKGAGWIPSWFDKDGNRHRGTAQPPNIQAHGGPLATVGSSFILPVRHNTASQQHLASPSIRKSSTISPVVDKDGKHHSGTAQPSQI